MLEKLFDGALSKPENTDDLNTYFNTIFEGSDQIATWANMLRNNLIPERKDSPNNITQLIIGKTPDITKLASDTWSNMNGDTFIDIAFRNKTFSAMLFNVIQQGGLFTPENEYLAGLESILPSEMIELIIENFGDRYDRYLTSLEVVRAPHALALLNDGFDSIKSRNKKLEYFDRKNASLTTLNFVEKEASVAKILTDFSWLKERLLNGKNFTVLEESYLGRVNVEINPEYVNTRHGKCLFMDLSEFNQNSAGPNSGLRFKLNAGELINEPWEESEGLIAIVHQPQETLPQFDNYFYLPLKTTSEIQLSKSFEKRLPKPKGTCDTVENAPPIQQCLESCRIKKISETCKCKVSFDTENLNNLNNECSWYEIRNCGSKISEANQKSTYSSCECSIPCEENVISSVLKVRDRNGISGKNMKFDSDSLVKESLDAAQLELLLYYSVK